LHLQFKTGIPSAAPEPSTIRRVN